LDDFNETETLEDYQQADEQRVLQAQANYNLSSLNYTKSKPAAADLQDSESETEIFEKPNCKCEDISRNPKNKTKVCAIL
jgi:hypothetical protein